MRLVIGGIKGGSGKTTIATNLAVCRAIQGRKVWLIDADEQGSTLDWYNQRQVHLSNLVVEAIHGMELFRRISDQASQTWDDIIIDTGGRDTTSQRAALAACDAFLAPFRPRSFDIWTLTSVRQLQREIHEINPILKVMAVLNQCEPRGNDKRAARSIIEEHGIDCLKPELGYRKSYSDAASEGLGVIELKSADPKSIQEILSLHDDIYKGNMLHTFNTTRNDIWQLAEK